MADEKPPLRGWVEFPQYTRQRIPMFMVREQLVLHGLHIVSAAEKGVLDAMAPSWRLDAERRVLQACTDAGRENLEFIAKAGSGPVVAIARATLELLDARRKETKDAP